MDTIKVYDIQAPESITDLGLRYLRTDISTGKVKNSLLAETQSCLD